MRILGIINTLRLKLNILIINPSQIPVISATGLVEKPQRVREIQFIINVYINMLEAFTTIIRVTNLDIYQHAYIYSSL